MTLVISVPFRKSEFQGSGVLLYIRTNQGDNLLHARCRQFFFNDQTDLDIVILREMRRSVCKVTF